MGCHTGRSARERSYKRRTCLHTHGEYPRLQRILHLRTNVKTETRYKTKNSKKNKRLRDTECFQNITFLIEIKNNKDTFKTKSIILYNIMVFYFPIKVSGPLKGGVSGGEG